jgi:hypothetical protein
MRKIVILLFIGLSFPFARANAWLGYFDDSQAVLKRASENAQLWRSVGLNGELNGSSEKDGSLYLRFGGENTLDASAPLAEYDISADIISTKARQTASTSAEISLKLIDKDLYVALRNDAKFGTFDLSGFKDKWIKFALREVSRTKIEKGQSEKIKQAFWSDGVLVIVDESGFDLSRYHFRVAFDPAHWKQFIKDYSAITGRTMSEAEVASSIESIKSIKGEVWIGRWSKEFSRIALHSSAKGMNWTADVKFDTLNPQVKVEIPSDSKDFESVLQEQLSRSLPNNVRLQVKMKP